MRLIGFKLPFLLICCIAFLLSGCDDSSAVDKLVLQDVVWTVGANRSGALGNGNEFDTKFPNQILALNEVIRLEASKRNSMALTSNFKLFTWGDDTFGQLGNGGFAQNANVPVQVLLDDPIIAMSSGNTFSAAVGASGKLWLWGWKFLGVPGNFELNSTTPKLISIVQRMTDIACSENHCLALSESGEVWAWGSNTTGALGNGSTAAQGEFQKIDNLTNVIDVAVGSLHSLALTSNGEVYAWGSHAAGQLGLGTTSTNNILTPTKISSIVNAVSITAGDFHTLCLVDGGDLYAWGEGSNGQLGSGSFDTLDDPRRVSFIGKVKLAYASGLGSCALTEDGRFYSWGIFYAPQSPFGSNIDRRTAPTPMPCLDNATVIARADGHYLVAKANAEVGNMDCFAE